MSSSEEVREFPEFKDKAELLVLIASLAITSGAPSLEVLTSAIETAYAIGRDDEREAG